MEYFGTHLILRRPAWPQRFSDPGNVRDTLLSGATIDLTDPPRPQLGPLDRLLPLVAWRHSVLQHLPYRIPRQPKLSGYRSLTPALNSNRTTYPPIYLHLEHPSGVP